jgi:hypothetical protein
VLDTTVCDKVYSTNETDHQDYFIGILLEVVTDFRINTMLGSSLSPVAQYSQCVALLFVVT